MPNGLQYHKKISCAEAVPAFKDDLDDISVVNSNGASDGLYFVRWVGLEASKAKKIILSR